MDLRKWTWSRGFTCFKVCIKLHFTYRLYYAVPCAWYFGIRNRFRELSLCKYFGNWSLPRSTAFFFTFAINYIPCKSYHVNISLEAARVFSLEKLTLARGTTFYEMHTKLHCWNYGLVVGRNKHIFFWQRINSPSMVVLAQLCLRTWYRQQSIRRIRSQVSRETVTNVLTRCRPRNTKEMLTLSQPPT